MIPYAFRVARGERAGLGQETVYVQDILSKTRAAR